MQALLQLVPLVYALVLLALPRISLTLLLPMHKMLVVLAQEAPLKPYFNSNELISKTA